MGQIINVTCPSCGYSTKAWGIHGHVGKLGYWKTTRVCDQTHELVDCTTTAPAENNPRVTPAEEEPCPKCNGTDHPAWQLKPAGLLGKDRSGPCPRCGKNCTLQPVGFWD